MEGLIVAFKLGFTVVALPLVVALTMSFNQELDRFGWFGLNFKAAVFAYVIVHFFIFPLKFVYDIGQKVLGFFFRFSKPLSELVPLFFPFFTMILLFGLWFITANHLHAYLNEYLAFFIGLTFAMHIILTAQTFRENDPSPAKSHYLFVMTLVYVFDLFLIICALSLISKNIAIASFWSTGMAKAKDFYLVFIHYLF